MWEYLASTKYGWLNTRERAACILAVMKRQAGHGNWARMVRDFLLAGDKLIARVAQRVHEPHEPVPPTQPVQSTPTPSKAAA